MRIALITIFSIILFAGFSGCISFGDKDPADIEWIYPDKPETEEVEFEKVSNGYFLTKEEANRLAKNIEELKAYSLKLEKLIEKMEEHYD